MSQKPTKDYESLSEPENEPLIDEKQDSLNDTKSLCHWNQQTYESYEKDPNIFRENLSNRERITAVMLCKELMIESQYSNLDVETPTKEWYIHDEHKNEWEQVLKMISSANCDMADLNGLSPETYVEISKSLETIRFFNLTELAFEGVPIVSLNILAFIDAPSLYRLKIEHTVLTTTKSIHKTNLHKIKSITIKNHLIQRFEMLPRMRVSQTQFSCSHTKGNLVLFGLFGANTDFMFHVKMEGKNVIANMKQSFKLETDESIREIAEELERNQQKLIIKQWNKNYSLIIKNSKRILMRYEENQGPVQHAH